MSSKTTTAKTGAAKASTTPKVKKPTELKYPDTATIHLTAKAKDAQGNFKNPKRKNSMAHAAFEALSKAAPSGMTYGNFRKEIAAVSANLLQKNFNVTEETDWNLSHGFITLKLVDGTVITDPQKKATKAAVKLQTKASAPAGKPLVAPKAAAAA